MRNFSSMVGLTNSFAVDVRESVDGNYINSCREALLITMGANPSMLTPSERGTLSDFTEWFLDAVEDDRKGIFPQKPVFFCANLHEGHSVVFVAVDSKSSLQLLSR